MNNEEKLEDFKDAIRVAVDKTKATNATELMCELLSILWADGFSRGQEYEHY